MASTTNSMTANYTITTPNEEVFAETVSLYHLLGFKLVAVSNNPAAARTAIISNDSSLNTSNKTNTKTNTAAGSATSSSSSPVWMKLFANTDYAGASPCICIRIDADSSSQAATASKDASDARSANNAENRFSFNSDNMQDIESALRKLGHPFKSVGLAVDQIIEVTDPVGTMLTIGASRPDPVAHVNPASHHHSTADTPYPAHKMGSDSQPSLLAGVHQTFSLSPTKKRIGILTSGGDSSGMNAAVRAIVRVSLQRNCVPYAIFEGYQGLVDGAEKIKPMGWESVRGFLAVGGTSIGTARCSAFRTREGRLEATFNLITNGIDALVVIGGDGSLTGADILRAEWTTLVDELVQLGRVTKEESNHLRSDLTIVGLVGSIDNDMSATDITIGAVTSLHRICEAVDSLTSTAQSHQRAFVVEVMGRHCGWLGLMAAIAVGADWVCLPERPPPLDSKYGTDWAQEMVDTVKKYRSMGSRKSIIIVCEGAIDKNLKPIKAEDVKTALETKLGLDTRVTTLGHVQRGGSPCAFDRYLATVQGVEAVEAVLTSSPGTPAPMIGMSQNKVISVPLMDAVQLTQSVAKAISQKDFKHAMELRDPDFTAAFGAYTESTLLGGPGISQVSSEKRLRIGIMHCGAPAGGMNAATRVAVSLCLNRGHVPLAIRNGFTGLVNDEVKPLKWEEVVGWQVRGGSELGTNRDHPRPLAGFSKLSPKGVQNFIDLGLIAYHFQKHGIQALLIIGGFEAYTAQLTLTEARGVYPAFSIPMVHLPATVSNNVPGTDYSIGCDTALNVIVESCDRLKLSANASRKRVFVVEVQGGTCGYLATLGGLTVGATNVYIPEQEITIQTLQKDITHLCKRYTDDEELNVSSEGRVILRTESTLPAVYSTEVVSGILRAEGKGLFDSRTAVLGHLQQGGVPSPLDRVRATRLAVKCIDWLESVAGEVRVLNAAEALNSHSSSSCGVAKYAGMSIYTTNRAHSTVIGIRGASVVFSPIEDLVDEVDMKRRRSKNAWWMGLGRLIRVLSKYEYDT
ncbi:hypothetical protein BASA50_002592 [Batrachochytrium salamandrivorans]|uniref:ATP-dependent 6-phosphofructokinase n=1 Tax=Batrachochytrium salamandrivorans TaxID=1357716 RepID=A0ABQ8FKQ3_9FUNG|nr:hypothetical protein BASA62_002281 [Batrachochytrium salamandrivorans]KAH6579395.1 hypothetical protein BASA61_010278 [Batrachochytrium salamandrivorans]KAH6600004.1 hypothetical protein BASA50_002592 [Batrachochytrium salamandrivorans]